MLESNQVLLDGILIILYFGISFIFGSCEYMTWGSGWWGFSRVRQPGHHEARIGLLILVKRSKRYLVVHSRIQELFKSYNHLRSSHRLRKSLLQPSFSPLKPSPWVWCSLLQTMKIAWPFTLGTSVPTFLIAYFHHNVQSKTQSRQTITSPE